MKWMGEPVVTWLKHPETGAPLLDCVGEPTFTVDFPKQGELQRENTVALSVDGKGTVVSGAFGVKYESKGSQIVVNDRLAAQELLLLDESRTYEN
ncbi:MAG: hypothetical protein EBY11_15150, partial [Proteobacteria bacterium]|nr:hypothetical protein [Pseudomonadota bacterium]